MRSTACWSWDARSLSASPDPERSWGECARPSGPCNTLARARGFCCKVRCSSGMSGLAFQYRAAQAAIWNNSAMKVA